MPRICGASLAGLALLLSLSPPAGAIDIGRLSAIATCQKKIATAGTRFAMQVIKETLKCTLEVAECQIQCDNGVFGPPCDTNPGPGCCDPAESCQPIANNAAFCQCMTDAGEACVVAQSKIAKHELTKQTQIVDGCSPLSTEELCGAQGPGLSFATLWSGCVALHPLLKCVGGSADGLACTSVADCPGGSCDPNALSTCRGGFTPGQPCSTNADCCHAGCCATNADCSGACVASSPFECVGGSAAGQTCQQDSDCPGGSCEYPCDLEHVLHCVGGPLERRLTDQISALLNPRAGDAVAALDLRTAFPGIPIRRRVKNVVAAGKTDIWAVSGEADDEIRVIVTTADDNGDGTSNLQPTVALVGADDQTPVANTDVQDMPCGVANVCGSPCPTFSRRLPFAGTFHIAVGAGATGGCTGGTYRLLVVSPRGTTPVLVADDVAPATPSGS